MRKIALPAITVAAMVVAVLHTAPAHVAEYFGLEGPNYSCLTACAAGSQLQGRQVGPDPVGNPGARRQHRSTTRLS